MESERMYLLGMEFFTQHAEYLCMLCVCVSVCLPIVNYF